MAFKGQEETVVNKVLADGRVALHIRRIISEFQSAFFEGIDDNISPEVFHSYPFLQENMEKADRFGVLGQGRRIRPGFWNRRILLGFLFHGTAFFNTDFFEKFINLR